MDDSSAAPTTGGEDGGYAVPPQFPAPPDVRGRPAAGPPLLAPEEPAAVWGPAAPPAEPDRWSGAPPHRYGGTALLERTTVSRRPVVAAPVRPLPPAPAAQSWEWERSHGLRNALIAAAAILLVGSLIAAFVVFRHQQDDKKPAATDPPPAAQPLDPSLDPTAGGATATTGPPVIPPVTPVPVAPATTAAAVPATTAPPATAAPVTTKAPTSPTTQRPTPTVTASPPYTGGPFPTQKPTTTVPRTTTSTTRQTG